MADELPDEFIALHARLVAIEDSGGAGKGVEQEGRHAHPPEAPDPRLGGEAEGRALPPGGRRRLGSAQEEVWEDGSNKVAYDRRRKYLLGSETHGLMNYPFRDEVPVFRVLLVHRREGPHAPPGVVFVRPGLEGVPGEVGALPALGRAGVRIEAVGVEVAAVAAGVVEHTVDDDRNSHLFGLGTEGLQVLLIP